MIFSGSVTEVALNVKSCASCPCVENFLDYDSEELVTERPNCLRDLRACADCVGEGGQNSATRRNFLFSPACTCSFHLILYNCLSSLQALDSLKTSVPENRITEYFLLKKESDITLNSSVTLFIFQRFNECFSFTWMRRSTQDIL